MRKWYVLAVTSVGVAVAASVSFASNPGAGVTIKAKENPKIAPNKYFQDGVHFTPGTVSVASGSMLTFTFADKKVMEPHTLTIVNKSDLPKTVAQVENCKPCQKYATPHLKNPKAPPDQNNPIVRWKLNKGRPGLDTVGDSVAIQEPGPHKTISILVSAKPGTTLYFMCAVHAWMQGKIIVK